MDNPEAHRPQAVPWLFDGYGLAILVLATLLAVSLEAPQVAFLAGSLLLLGLVSRLWARFSVARLVYTRRVTPGRAFCGETVVLETSLSNRKVLPLPWVESWERLPLALNAGSALERSLENPDHAWMRQGAALGPYQRARWQHQLECRHRGVYRLASAWARSGDPFGLLERETRLPHQMEVVVYPRVVPLRRLAFLFRHPSMDVASRRSLLSDPTRTAGLREYQPGDPQRLIHWRASAHRGALQVRLLEHATSLQVSLVLGVRSFELPWELYRENLFELALSALASIAMYLSQAGHAVGLFTDASPPSAMQPSANPAQLQALLETLARVRPLRSSLAEGWTLSRLPRGSAVVLVVSDAAQDLAETLARLEQAGHQVMVLLCGRSPAPTNLPAERFVRLIPGQDLAAALEGRA